MLHYQTITEDTLAILKHVQNMPAFSEYRLVGGTALALHFGHRVSVDLDFFGKRDLTIEDITEGLHRFGEVRILKNSPAIKVLSVNNIKMDVVNYKYDWIEDSLNEDGLILAKVKDIAAMKIAAITGGGSKKDFFDLTLLLKYYSLEEILNFFGLKYPDSTVYLALKSLIYFDDADQEPDPIMFELMTWKEVKKVIERKQEEYLRSIGG